MIEKNEVLAKLEEIEMQLAELEQKLEQSINTDKEIMISKKYQSHLLLEGKIQKLENKLNGKNSIKRFTIPFENNTTTLDLSLQKLV